MGRMKASKAKISPERAQDWISGALNPIIEGLRREICFLPSGPWRWLFQTRTFEYLHAIQDYVAEIYLDNYEDFMAKYPKLRPELEEHDAALGELCDAISMGFDTLNGVEGADFRSKLEREVAPRNVDEAGQRYFLAYLASGYHELPSSYSNHEIYNALPGDLRDQANALLAEPRTKAEAAAKRLENIDKQLLERLRSLRTKIADRYGARVRPVIE